MFFVECDGICMQQINKDVRKCINDGGCAIMCLRLHPCDIPVAWRADFMMAAYNTDSDAADIISIVDFDRHDSIGIMLLCKMGINKQLKLK